MVKREEFVTQNGYLLTVVTNKTNIQFELQTEDRESMTDYKRRWLTFDTVMFKDLYDYLMVEANKVWQTLTIKEADSGGNDYDEYYDRVLDNNGYLSIKSGELGMALVYEGSDRVYQFNKSKMGTFLYDYQLELNK